MIRIISLAAASTLSLAIASPALASWDPAYTHSYDRQLVEAGQRVAQPASGSVIATNDKVQVVSIDRAVESKDSHRDN